MESPSSAWSMLQRGLSLAGIVIDLSTQMLILELVQARRFGVKPPPFQKLLDSGCSPWTDPSRVLMPNNDTVTWSPTLAPHIVWHNSKSQQQVLKMSAASAVSSNCNTSPKNAHFCDGPSVGDGGCHTHSLTMGDFDLDFDLDCCDFVKRRLSRRE